MKSVFIKVIYIWICINCASCIIVGIKKERYIDYTMSDEMQNSLSNSGILIQNDDTFQFNGSITGRKKRIEFNDYKDKVLILKLPEDVASAGTTLPIPIPGYNSFRGNDEVIIWIEELKNVSLYSHSLKSFYKTLKYVKTKYTNPEEIKFILYLDGKVYESFGSETFSFPIKWQKIKNAKLIIQNLYINDRKLPDIELKLSLESKWGFLFAYWSR